MRFAYLVLLLPSLSITSGFSPPHPLSLPRGGGVYTQKSSFYEELNDLNPLDPNRLRRPRASATSLYFRKPQCDRAISSRTSTSLRGGSQPSSSSSLPLTIVEKSLPLFLPLAALTLTLTLTSPPLPSSYSTDCVLSVFCAVLATAWVKVRQGCVRERHYHEKTVQRRAI